MEIDESRLAEVGGLEVRRALPQRHRRTVGAWCFVDHFGPTEPDEGYRMKVGPHPHIGLSTVTWLIDGEALHTDSLGSEQPIRPGQLNLMTAGNGIAHAEETPIGRDGRMHGVQFWVAQPESTRHGAPAFEHHGELPRLDLGSLDASLLVGSLLGTTAPTRADTPMIGLDLLVRAGSTELPLDPAFEHAVVVTEGSVTVAEGTTRGGSAHRVEPGQLAYLDPGRSSVTLQADGPARAVLVGGEPFEAPVLMWWNFVGRERDEIERATDEWNAGSDRFGSVASGLDRIPAPTVPWTAGGRSEA